jgi:hypothetical protein
MNQRICLRMIAAAMLFLMLLTVGCISLSPTPTPPRAAPTQVDQVAKASTATAPPPTPTSLPTLAPTATVAPPTPTRTATPVPPTPAPTVDPCSGERLIGEGGFKITVSSCAYTSASSVRVIVSITGTRPFQGTGHLNDTGNWVPLCGVCWMHSHDRCVDARLVDSVGVEYRDRGYTCSSDGKNLRIEFAVPLTANGLLFYYSDPQFDYPSVQIRR